MLIAGLICALTLTLLRSQSMSRPLSESLPHVPHSRLRHLCVVDHCNQLQGIITRADLANLAAEAEELEERYGNGQGRGLAGATAGEKGEVDSSPMRWHKSALIKICSTQLPLILTYTEKGGCKPRTVLRRERSVPHVNGCRK